MRWPFISFIRNLSGLHCCLFVKVLLLLLCSNLFILAQVVCFVNNFFEFFQIPFCFAFLFRNASAEGGIWTLAPLLTTCTLSRGVPSASLGTSPNICHQAKNIRLTTWISFNTVAIFYSYTLSKKQRRGWDSNPRALADKRFSRPPRYDHFDTSPYNISIKLV